MKVGKSTVIVKIPLKVDQEVDLTSLHLQEEEVQAVRWCGKEEALKMQEQGIMVPYWFLDKLFEVRGMQDAHGSRKKF